MKFQNNTDGSVSRKQTKGRWLLGFMLMAAGTSHLTFARTDFRAQVPDWVPMNTDLVVVLSGIIEILLGMAIAFWSRKRIFWGWIAALFFILVFPGNIAQFTNRRNAFGLNTDLARGLRLLMQPVLVFWALWESGAWQAWRRKIETR